MKKLHMPYLQISQAALHIYAAEGPKGLTMRRVAAAVGVRASALYRHFRNKDELIDAVVRAVDDRLACALTRRARSRSEQRDPVGTASRRALAFARDNQHLFQLLSRRKPRWDGRTEAALREQVVRAIEKGRVHLGDPQPPATALWSQFCGLSALRERGELESDRQLGACWRDSMEHLQRGLT